MKENRGDKVVDTLNARISMVRKKLHTDMKNTKPFRQEEVTPEERIFWYRDLTPEDTQFLVEKHGEDKVMDEFNEIETLMRRRGI